MGWFRSVSGEETKTIAGMEVFHSVGERENCAGEEMMMLPVVFGWEGRLLGGLSRWFFLVGRVFVGHDL